MNRYSERSVLFATVALLGSFCGVASASNFTGNATGTGLLGAEPSTSSVDVFAGSATSTYSFVIPPGRAVLQPDLTIRYNSGSSRQGMLGRGWNLNLPSIQRNVRFGQPQFAWVDQEFTVLWNGVLHDLFMMADSTSGGVGIREFRTEIETFLRIRSYTDPTGFTYWEVEDGKGRTYQFGNPGHDGASTHAGDFRWAVNRVQDSHGNYMTFSWLTDSLTLYPKEIRYTGHIDGTIPAHRVEFAYEQRLDTIENVIGTKRSLSPATIRYRLHRIKTWAGDGSGTGDVAVSNYIFDYNTAGTGDYWPDLCAGVTCSASSLFCPGTGGTASCANTCNPQTGFCTSCAPNCCAGVTCGQSSMFCPGNASMATCQRGCDTQTGYCQACTPDCCEYPCAPITTTCTNGSLESCYPTCNPSYGCLACIPDCDPVGGGGGGGCTGCPPVLESIFPGELESSATTSVGAVWPSLLQMITQYNGDGTKVLPATRFTYYEDGPAAIGWTSVGSQIPVSFLWKNSTANGRDAQDFGVQLVDVNRDALPDVVQAYDPNDATGPEDSLRQVFLNVGGEWASTPSTVWVPPADTVVHDLGRQEYDNGVRFVDLNGDKLVDVVMYALVGESGSPITGVWLNSVNGWGPQEPQGAWSLPEAFSRINPTGEEAGKIGVDRGVRFGDVNGDGLVDLVLGRDGAGGHHGHVYLNTGNAGWTDTNSSSWIVPQSFIYQYDGRSTADLGTRLIDVNGDGLADLVRSNVSVLSSLEAVGVWINRGTPDALGNLWVQDPEYEIPEYFTFVDVELPFIGGSDDSDDLGVRFADVNGDGKVDLIVARRWEGTSTSCGFGSNTCQAIYLQTADKKWVFDAGWSETIPATYFFIEHRAGAEDYDDGVRLADIDGNGTVDLLKSMAGEGADNDGRQNHDELSELLKRVELPVGGTSEFVYQSSAYYPNGLPGEPVGTSAGFLPYTIPVVSESTISDGGSGLGHSYTSRYAYGQGFYHTKRREFRGFRVVRTEMPGGMAYTQRILAQERDLDFAPLVGAVEWEYTRRSSDDSLYSVKERRFDRSDSAPPRFHWMEFEDEYLFDWSTSAAMEDVNLSMAEKRVSTAHVYAFEQNLGPYFAFAIWHETQTLGDEATPSDDSFTREDYTNDQAKWWIGVPKHRIMTDAPGMTGNRLQEEWLYYDDYNDSLSHGVIGVAGNLSKAEAWSGESGDGMGAANNRTELKHFDVYGNVTQSVDGDGHSVNLSYGGVERTKTLPDEIHIETGLGGGLVTHQETYAYDHRFGLPLVVTRPGQVTLQASYDSFGRLEKAWMPLDSPSTPTTCVQYDVTSRPIVVKRFRRENSGAGETCGPVGMLAETEFIDGLGRTIEKKAEGGGPAYLSTVVQATSFDERGLPAKEYRAFFSGSAFDVYHSPTGSPGIAYQYDALGRKTRVTPDGLPSIERTYDGWTTARRDSENRLTASDVDAFGRVIQYRTYDENEAIYATTSVEYDPLGRLMKVRDTLGNEWEYTYNPFGQRLTTNDPDAGGTTTRYNKDGTVKETIDAFNRTTTYEYDALHRLRFKYRADGSHVENRYDEASGGPGGRGWLTSSVDSATGISEAYVYDLLGRVTTQRLFADGPVQDEIVRQYDAMDRVVSIRYPENTTITYGFGTDGRVNAINGYVDLVRYTPTGALKSYQLHNGVSVTNTYNPTTNRLESRTAARPVGLPVQSLSYQYKPTGYLESITDLVGTASQVFTLDHQYRLKQAVGGYGNKQYDYDVLGNMTLKENVSFTRSPTKPHQILTGSGGRTFTYYEDGSLWTATSAEEEWEYTYDLDGRLRLATEELAGVEAEFVYAPGGGRAKKIESTGNGPSTTTIQMGDLYQKVGGNEKIFIYLGSERIAEVNSSSTRFMLSDHTNSTSVVTDSVGVVEQRTEYRPYGEVSSLQGDGLSLDFGFAGARREPNLGLSDFGARFYSPSLGRFLNVDSLFSPEGHPGSLNRYGYGLGNPVSFTDIGGLFAFPLFWVYEAFGTSGVDSGMVQNPYPIGAVRDVEQWQTCCSTQVGVSSPPTPAWPIGILLADSGTGPAVAQSQDGISELKIVTEIRPPDAQEGMKSTQIVRVDRRTGELSEWHWTGRTWVPFFGQVISSRGDAFTAEVSGPEDALTVKMTGETASRLWWSKINYTFVLGFDSSSGTWAAIGGAHDGYPSYVVTADGLVIYNFSQGSIWDLNGCCDVEVGR